MAPRAAPGSVSLSARLLDGRRLEVRVSDDGVGLPDDWRLANSKGMGLLNTEARLRQLYGANFTLEVRNRERGGVVARLAIPLHRSSSFDNDEQNAR